MCINPRPKIDLSLYYLFPFVSHLLEITQHFKDFLKNVTLNVSFK